MYIYKYINIYIYVYIYNYNDIVEHVKVIYGVRGQDSGASGDQAGSSDWEGARRRFLGH